MRSTRWKCFPTFSACGFHASGSFLRVSRRSQCRRQVCYRASPTRDQVSASSTRRKDRMRATGRMRSRSSATQGSDRRANRHPAPRWVTGTAVGFVSFIGFTPDVFVAFVGGVLLDRSPGLVGHQHFFLFLAVFAAIGIIASYVMMRMLHPANKTAATPKLN